MKPSAILDKSKQLGITLIELLISIVVLGIALVAIVSVISGSAGRSSHILLENRTIQVAQAYFDEILSKRFAETTGTGGFPPAVGCTISREETAPGNGRAVFDDVDDYHGLNEAPSSQTASTFYGGSGNFNIRVDVSCADAANELGVPAGKAKRVTLTITDPNGRQRVFAAYKGNY